jgi:hypothetical protein
LKKRLLGLKKRSKTYLTPADLVKGSKTNWKGKKKAKTKGGRGAATINLVKHRFFTNLLDQTGPTPTAAAVASPFPVITS